MLANYPQPDQHQIDQQADAQIHWLKSVIVGIRNIRSEMTISPGVAIAVLLKDGDQTDRRNLDLSQQLLCKLANLESIRWLEDSEQAPMASTVLIGEMELLVPMAGLIDITAEQQRLEKEIAKLDLELAKINGKLGNQNFVSRAPAEVVNKEQQRLAEINSAIARLNAQVEALSNLN